MRGMLRLLSLSPFLSRQQQWQSIASSFHSLHRALRRKKHSLRGFPRDDLSAASGIAIFMTCKRGEEQSDKRSCAMASHNGICLHCRFTSPSMPLLIAIIRGGFAVLLLPLSLPLNRRLSCRRLRGFENCNNFSLRSE
jgi:hypothetical protein